MSRKDYERIASLVRDERDLFASNTAHAKFAFSLGLTLADDNARFDLKRFLQACRPSHVVGTKYDNVWERMGA